MATTNDKQSSDCHDKGEGIAATLTRELQH